MHPDQPHHTIHHHHPSKHVPRALRRFAAPVAASGGCTPPGRANRGTGFLEDTSVGACLFLGLAATTTPPSPSPPGAALAFAFPSSSWPNRRRRRRRLLVLPTTPAPAPPSSCMCMAPDAINARRSASGRLRTAASASRLARACASSSFSSPDEEDPPVPVWGGVVLWGRRMEWG
jgi:hypothetical protein